MLKRITVENFKSLKHLDYSCSKLNLLMGLNGAGKSSFVQLLLLMRKLAQKPLKAVVNLSELNEFETNEDVKYTYAADDDSIAFNASFTPRGSTAVCENRKTQDGKTFLDFDSMYMMFPAEPDPDDITADSLISVKRLMRIDVLKKQYKFWEPSFVSELITSPEFKKKNDFLQIHGGSEDAIHESDDEFLRAEYGDIYWEYHHKYESLEAEVNKKEDKKDPYYRLLWRNMKFVEAFRMKPREVHSGGRHSQEEWQSRKVAFDPEGEDVAEFLYKVGALNVIDKDNPMIYPSCQDKLRLIDQVNAWLQVVSPGAQVRIEKREVSGSERFIESVAFGRSGHEHEFKPQNVGFGISYVLPVLVSLLTSVPEDIVIIENPEAHLHPRGQAEMGNLIARAAAYGVQVFVETHSDHVINGIRVAVKKGIVKPEDVNIAFFERKGHEIIAEDGAKRKEYYADVRNIKIDNNGSLSEYPEDFMDEWNNQLMRLMRPRKK